MSPRFLILVALVSAGCLARDRIAYEATEPTTSLVSPLESTGILVLECTMEDRSPAGTQKLAIEGAAITRLADGHRAYTSPNEDFLVFDGLEPGPYRLAYVRSVPWITRRKASGRLESGRDQRTYRLAQEQGVDFMVEVGRPTYVGRVRVANARSQTECEVEHRESEKAEKEAWRKILAIYPETHWNGPIRARMEEL